MNIRSRCIEQYSIQKWRKNGALPVVVEISFQVPSRVKKSKPLQNNVKALTDSLPLP